MVLNCLELLPVGWGQDPRECLLRIHGTERRLLQVLGRECIHVEGLDLGAVELDRLLFAHVDGALDILKFLRFGLLFLVGLVNHARVDELGLVVDVVGAGDASLGFVGGGLGLMLNGAQWLLLAEDVGGVVGTAYVVWLQSVGRGSAPDR